MRLATIRPQVPVEAAGRDWVWPNFIRAGNVWAANNWNSLEAAARPESGSSHVDLGRRVGLHRDLWSGNAREAIGNVQTY